MTAKTYAAHFIRIYVDEITIDVCIPACRYRILSIGRRTHTIVWIYVMIITLL